MSLLFVGVAFEVYLRQIGFLQAQPAAYPCITGDYKLNHVFQPNCKGTAYASALHTSEDVVYEVNDHGLRMGPIHKEAKKIIIIGDSYTEGFGLKNQDSFPLQLEAQFHKLGANNWQVVNAGTLGFSPVLYVPYYLERLKNIGAKYVLLNLDFTDLTDDVYFLSHADFSKEGEVLGYPSREIFSPILVALTFKNYSAVLRFIHQELNLWNQGRWSNRSKKYINHIVDAEPRLIADDWLQTNEETKNCRKNFELTAKFIQKLKNATEESGAHFAIHMYPPGYSLKKRKPRSASLSFFLAWQNLTRKDFSYSCSMSEAGVDVFRKYAASQHIPFFSSIEFMRNRPNREALYFEEDAHWNKFGVRAVTEFLAPKLLKDFLQLSGKQGKRSGQYK